MRNHRQPNRTPRPRRQGVAPAPTPYAALGAVVAGAADGDVGPRSGAPKRLLVAVVHTTDEVRFVAASPSRDELVRQLAAYVRQSAPHTLRTGDAAHVGALLGAGKLDAAITHYFSTVGRRWDEEWLVTTNVRSGAVADAVPPTLLWPRACGTVYLPSARRSLDSG